MPYLRLSGFYYFYFALLGVLVPYWTLYLESLRFGPEVIGLLMGMLHLTRVLAPNLWGWLADRTGERVRIVRFGALAATVCFVPIFWQQGALGVGLVMLGFSFFWNAVLPQFEVITLQYLGKASHEYSRVRVWGSIGFICAVVAVGGLLDLIGVVWVPWVVLGLLALIWLNTLLINMGAAGSVERPVDGVGIWHILRQPQVAAFFAVCFLVQFGHGPYYTFYSVLMQDLGYGRTAIGLLWALGVLAEVGIFLLMPRLLEGLGLRSLMLISLLLCVLRWGLIAVLPESLGVMLFAQLLHAATFGCLHAVGIALVQHYFTPATSGRGQALFSSLGFGAGGAIGAVVSGLMWESLGQYTFLVASLAALVAWGLAWVWIRPDLWQPFDR